MPERSLYRPEIILHGRELLIRGRNEDEQQTLARELLKAFQSVLTVRENDTFEPTSKHDGDASTIDTVVVAALKASRNTSSATI